VADNLRKPENLAYYQFLRSSREKICITSETKNIIDNCIKSLHNNPWVSKLLFESNELENIEYFNELEIYWEHDGIPLKSKLDRVIVDHRSKTIKIIDLKTTNKKCYWKAPKVPVLLAMDNTYFYDSYLKYRYYRQQAFYNSAVMSIKDYKSYKIENIIIPIETSGNYDCCILSFSSDGFYINKGNEEWMSILEDYKWHLENGLWEYPRYIYKNQGIIDVE
jgi:hypothetical protein